MSNATRVALAIVAVLLLIIAGWAVNYFMTAHLISRSSQQQKTLIAQSKADENAAIRAAVAYSDQQWCGALSLLTSHPTPKPADPAANPSREGEYLFYLDLVTIKTKFKC
jgi:hypothetical protein